MAVDPRMTHATEQLAAHCKELAPILVGFFEQLVRLGYPPELADRRVADLQRQLFGPVAGLVDDEKP